MTLQKVRAYGYKTSFVYGMHELKRVYYRMAMDSYSQNKEDLIIEKLCGRSSKGFYVDVGAHDPNHFSNTRYFYGKGWRGINIDPNPEAHQKFLKMRPEDINLCAAVGECDGMTLPFYEMFPPTVSTFSEQLRDLNLNRGCKLVNTVTLPVARLATLLHKNLPTHTEIDFMSIDTEGHDLITLATNDWDKFRPRVIIMESPTQFVGADESWNQTYEQYSLLRSKGYALALHSGIDAFFIRKNININIS